MKPYTLQYIGPLGGGVTIVSGDFVGTTDDDKLVTVPARLATSLLRQKTNWARPEKAKDN